MLPPVPPVPPSRPTNPIAAIACALGAVAIFSVQDVFVKLLAADYPVMQILGLRSLVMIMPGLIFLRAEGGLKRLRTRRPVGHLVRCILSFFTFVTFYVALARLSLGEVATILFAAPLLTTAMSGPLLGERVGWHRWVAVFIGFLGVLLVVGPGTNTNDYFAMSAALASSLGYALTWIQTRRLSQTESSAGMLFYNAIFLALASLVTFPFQWVPLNRFALGLVIALGSLGGVAHYAMIHAYRLAPAYVIAPFDYTHLIWAMAFGYLIWAEVPGLGMLTGAMVIMGSGLYVLAREQRLAALHRSDSAGTRART